MARTSNSTALVPARSMAALFLVVMLVATTSCSAFDTPDPPVSFPPTPTGHPIASVVDIPLGNLDVGRFEQSVAPNDTSGDVFFLGSSTGDESQRPELVRWNADALYRLDPATGVITSLAGLFHGPSSYLEGIAATNGWVFWVERDLSLLRTRGVVRRYFLAMKADGTQRAVLAQSDTDHEVRTEDPPIRDGGFTAGGGTAMWLEVTSQGNRLHLFDTATARQVEVKNQPDVVALGRVYGDRVLLSTAKAGFQIYSIHSSQVMGLPAVFGKSTDCSLQDNCAVLNAEVVVALDSKRSQMPSCTFASTDSTTCAAPVSRLAAHWIELTCVVGSYAVGVTYQEDDASLELANVADPADHLKLADNLVLHLACGGRRVVYTGYFKGEEDRSSRDYLRVITLI